jgi:hypothetical protein
MPAELKIYGGKSKKSHVQARQNESTLVYNHSFARSKFS